MLREVYLNNNNEVVYLFYGGLKKLFNIFKFKSESQLALE